MRRSHVVIATISVIAIVVAIVIVSIRSSAQNTTTIAGVTPSATTTSTQAENVTPREMTDQKARSAVILRAYFLPPQEAGVSTADIQRYATSQMQQMLISQWDGALDGVTVTLDSLTFSKDVLPQEDSRQLTLEACVATTTTFENGESEGYMGTAIVTMLYNDGWQVDSIDEISGCDEGDEEP